MLISYSLMVLDLQNMDIKSQTTSSPVYNTLEV